MLNGREAVASGAPFDPDWGPAVTGAARDHHVLCCTTPEPKAHSSELVVALGYLPVTHQALLDFQKYRALLLLGRVGGLADHCSASADHGQLFARSWDSRTRGEIGAAGPLA
jgi:hypothetical protein